jgi:hypothetical protein
MKKNTVLLLAGLVAALLLVYCLFVMDMGGNETEFALEDASAVNSFTLTKMAKGVAQNEIHVWKDEEGQWKVMQAKQDELGKWAEGPAFSGNESRITEFLKTASVVAVKDKIADRAQQQALEVLKQNHTIVTFYEQKKVLKRYMIGATNNSQTGNLMMLDGAQNAFVVSRPGVEGYISVQYSTDLDGWREKLLMNVKGEELKLVSVTFGDSLAPLSWSLSRETSEGIWKMPGVDQPDGQAIKAYQQQFAGKVFAEGFASKSYPEMTDSLKRRTPDVRFYCETLDGKSTGLVLYARPENPNNFFGWVEGQGELLTVQRFVFDKYLVPVDYFRPRQQ